MPKFVPIIPANVTYKDIMDELPKGSTRVLEAIGQDENEMVMKCFNSCSENEDCQSWTLDVKKKKCYQYDDHVRLNGHQDGFYSGVKVYLCTQELIYIVTENFFF